MRRWIETRLVRLTKWIWKLIPNTRWCISKWAICGFWDLPHHCVAASYDGIMLQARLIFSLTLSLPVNEVSHHHYHIRFWYLRCCGCPGLRGRKHLATPHTRSPWIPVLTGWHHPGCIMHIVISFLTHADHVFLGLPQSLVPGSPNRVMELMHIVSKDLVLEIILMYCFVSVYKYLFEQNNILS